MQFQDTEKYDYYVLVTNSEILPQTYWYLTKSLERSNISFRLIDGYLLGMYLLSLEDPKLQHALNNPYSLSDHADFYYEYQVDTVVSQLTNRYDLYMLFRNYSNNEKHCVLQLRTDVDWNTSEDNISFVIAPSGAAVKKVTVEQKHFDGIFQTGRLYLYSKDYKKAREYLHTIETWLIAVDNISNVNVNLNYYKYLDDMFELLRHARKNLPLAKRALLMRVYITLHHFAPIKAVDECDIVLKKLKQYKMVDDRPFCLSIMELKAHALMNAGLYPDGEILLKEIQADWLCNKEILSDETLFDLYDRLAAVYRAFNLIDLSKTYNTLSITLADKLDDNRLRALAYRTKFKITLYPNMDLSSESLRKSIEATALMPSKRIETDNSLDVCALEILSNSNVHQDKLILKLNSMLQDIEANNLHRAQIHCFFLLAICNLLKSEEKATLLAKEYVDRAINLSTSYGIVGYLWRLYNLQAIIGIRMGFDSQHIYKIFFTVFDILKKQGLLYIGNRDACEGNILALSNIGYYLQERKFESQFYQTMSLVTFAGQEYSAYPNQNLSDNPVNTFLVQQYAKARKREILFAQNTPPNLLWDTQTRYLLIL